MGAHLQIHASEHTSGTDDIQSASNSQKGLATAAHISSLETNTSKITTTESRLTTAESKLNTSDTSESKVATLETEMDAVESKNTTQDSRLTTAESQIATINVDTSAIATNTSKNTTQDTRLDAVESVNTTQDTSITAVESKNTTQDTRLTTNESKNTTQDTRLTAVESVNTTQANLISSKADTADVLLLAGVAGGGAGGSDRAGPRAVGGRELEPGDRGRQRRPGAALRLPHLLRDRRGRALPGRLLHRAGDRDHRHRTGQRPDLLLRGHRRGRGRQRKRMVQPGVLYGAVRGLR